MPNDTRAIDCRTALTNLFDFLDQELTPERMQAMRDHLVQCTPCFEHIKFEERFLLALRGIHEERLCPEHVRLRVLTSLQEAGFTRH